LKQILGEISKKYGAKILTKRVGIQNLRTNLGGKNFGNKNLKGKKETKT